MDKRVVITGIGVVSANGLDTETYWKISFQANHMLHTMNI